MAEDIIGCKLMCPDCRAEMPCTDVRLLQDEVYLIGICPECCETVSFSVTTVTRNLYQYKMAHVREVRH